MQFTLLSYLTILSLLATVLGAVSGTPILLGRMDARDVFVPPVLDPNATTVWKVSQRYEVSWNTTNPPSQITNKTGRIQLRQGDRTLPLILAEGFDILQGHVPITVPHVPAGHDYSIVLFGDSGNFSPFFTITS